MSEKSSYLLFVKNLKNGSKSIEKSEDVWIISEVGKNMWKREHLHISDIASFRDQLRKERKGLSKTITCYGIIDQTRMVKHFIIDLAETVTELENNIKASRPENPKRLSSSDATIPLQYFEAYEEKVASGKSQKVKKKVSAQCKTSESGDILDRAAKKAKKSSKAGNSGKKPTERQQPKAEEGELVDNSPDVILIQEENKIEIEGNPLVPKLMEDDEKQPSEQDSIETLKKKLELLQNERDKSLKEAAALKAENEKLSKGVDHSEPILKKIQEEIKKIPDQIKVTTAALPACPIRKKIYAVPLEEEFINFNVPKGEMYVGLGRTIRHNDIIDIEDVADTFNKRGELVFNLICPDGLQNYSAGGRAKGDVKLIPYQFKKATKEILKLFQWENKKEVSKSKMKVFWRKQPGELRRRLQAIEDKKKGIVRDKDKKKSKVDDKDKKKGKNDDKDKTAKQGSKEPLSESSSSSSVSSDSDDDCALNVPKRAVKKGSNITKGKIRSSRHVDDGINDHSETEDLKNSGKIEDQAAGDNKHLPQQAVTKSNCAAGTVGEKSSEQASCSSQQYSQKRKSDEKQCATKEFGDTDKEDEPCSSKKKCFDPDAFKLSRYLEESFDADEFDSE